MRVETIKHILENGFNTDSFTKRPSYVKAMITDYRHDAELMKDDFPYESALYLAIASEVEDEFLK